MIFNQKTRLDIIQKISIRKTQTNKKTKRIMKKKIAIIGTSAFESWNAAEASANKDVIELLDSLSIGVLIAVVTEKKVKAFGYDEKGILRSKCWELIQSYSTITSFEELIDLKAEEARKILINYFENVGVEIEMIREEEVPA